MHTAEHPPLRTIIPHLLLPVLMGAIMALAYLGGFHKPVPHDLPVAVVGDAQVAGPAAAQIEQALGDTVEITVLPDRAAAEEALRHLEISGAFVPDADDATLLTAPAASDTTDTVVQRIFRGVADEAGVHLSVEEVVPLGDEDPSGQNAFFFLVALSVGGYATSIAIGAAAGRRRFRDRVMLGGAAAIVIPTLYLLIAAGIYGMFPGRILAVWAVSVLYVAGVLSVGIGLHPMLGRLCTVVFSSLFVALNFTSSSGVFAPVMQSGFFGWLNEFWIGAGFVDSVRRISSFPDASLAHPLWILFGWLIAGALLLLAGWSVERRRARIAARVAHLESRQARLERELDLRSPRATGQRAALTADVTADVEEELEENVAV